MAFLKILADGEKEVFFQFRNPLRETFFLKKQIFKKTKASALVFR